MSLAANNHKALLLLLQSGAETVEQRPLIDPDDCQTVAYNAIKYDKNQ